MKLPKINLSALAICTTTITIAGLTGQATIGSHSIYVEQKTAIAASPDLAFPNNAGPAVTTTSGRAEIALAQHLKRKKAKMYAAFWCPYCHKQKQMFGKEASSIITYIECDRRGKNPQTQLCRQAKITGYPTWEINGKYYPGLRLLSELAEISGYKGDRNFKNLVI